MGKLRLYIGDLRHDTVGRHSVMMPINIGYLSAYASSQIGEDNLEIKLFVDPGKLLQAIDEDKPDVLALSNYCWNNAVSEACFKYAKKKDPAITCIGGGPDFPIDRTECKTYLARRSDMDFYVYADGEVAFARLLQKLADKEEIKKLQSEPQEGVMSIHPESGDLVAGQQAPRIMKMDDIPSPYLNGWMDEWFDGNHAPMMETSRGCPFTCTFCVQGSEYYAKIAKFSVERIKDELTYIAKRMKDYPQILLAICDSNFGMYKRDVEIAHHMRELQDTYNWPNAFDVTTGKINYDRILKVVEILQNKMHVTTSVQSLHDETLELIKRKNISMDRYEDIQEELKTRGQFSSSELIIPMPGETRESFLKSCEMLLNAGVGRVLPHTTMMLKGTEMASVRSREKFSMKTQWRIIPKQFGEYYGVKTFEVEEVCIETNTMPFEHYLDSRGFALIISIYSVDQYDVFKRHNKELGIVPFELYHKIWEEVKAGNSPLSEIYNAFIEETRNENWDSREELVEHFNKPENYELLLTGDLGDNLLRKYTCRVFLEQSEASFDIGYKFLKELSSDKSEAVMKSLDAARDWATRVRNLQVLFDETSIKEEHQLDLNYDVKSWYDKKEGPLAGFEKDTSYRVYCGETQVDILKTGIELYGEEPYYRLGKTLINWASTDLWSECDPLPEKSAV